MKLTLEMLESLGACIEAQREFESQFPKGGDIQDVLDAMAEQGKGPVTWAEKVKERNQQRERAI